MNTTETNWKLEAAKKSAKKVQRFIARADRITKWVKSRPENFDWTLTKYEEANEEEKAWLDARPPQRAFPSKTAKHKAYSEAGFIIYNIPELKDMRLRDLDDLRAIVKAVKSL